MARQIDWQNGNDADGMHVREHPSDRTNSEGKTERETVKKGKWRVNLIFDLRWKCTRTLIGQVAGQHLSSSSAVETNREYLIRKTERHQANIHCMPVPWYISISNIGSVLNKRRNENGMNKHNTITKCHAIEPEHSVSAGWRLALVCYWHPFSFYLLHTSSLSMFDLFDVVFFFVNIFNKIECDSGHIPRLSVPRMLLHVDTATSRQNAFLRYSIFSHFLSLSNFDCCFGFSLFSFCVANCGEALNRWNAMELSKRANASRY